MGSASREALASARTVLGGAGADARAGADLLAAARILSGSRALLSAVASAAGDADKTRTLVDRVFSGSVSAPALTVLQAAAAARWSRSSELVDGLEELGLRALSASSSDSSGLAGELFSFARAVASDNALELALGDKRGDADRKSALVERLLRGKASDEAITVISHLVRDPRGRRTGAMLAGAAATIADEDGRRIAHVTSAEPLTAEQGQQVRSSLAARYGTVDLDVTIDPSVLGGLRIRVGHDVIDGTVRSRIDSLRQKLAG